MIIKDSSMMSCLNR